MAKTRNRNRSKRPSYKKRYTRKHRFSTAGKILPPLDVRKPSQLKEFERRLKKGPLTIILVYADWCGHCHTMMPHFDAASKSPSRSIQSVKVNEEMLNSVNNHINKNVNKSAKPLEVEGYPSIILVDNKGDKVTDVEAVRDTNTMTKVMSESGKLAPKNNTTTNNKSNNKSALSNANLDISKNSGMINKAPSSTSLGLNSNVGENKLKGSLNAMNVNKNTKPKIKPDDMLIKSEDMTKPNNRNKKINNIKNTKASEPEFDLEDSIAPSPINTFSLPNNKNKPVELNVPKDLETKADSLVNLRGPIEPPSPESDIIKNDLTPAEKVEGGGGCGYGWRGGNRGGSLIGSISQTAYTLATPAALLATASYVMKNRHTKSKRNKKSHKKSHKKSRKLAKRK